jgi:hypothetical protein
LRNIPAISRVWPRRRRANWRRPLVATSGPSVTRRRCPHMLSDVLCQREQ